MTLLASRPITYEKSGWSLEGNNKVRLAGDFLFCDSRGNPIELYGWTGEWRTYVAGVHTSACHNQQLGFSQPIVFNSDTTFCDSYVLMGNQGLRTAHSCLNYEAPAVFKDNGKVDNFGSRNQSLRNVPEYGLGKAEVEYI